MKILLIGVLVFFSWSALSNYIYVCKIKGLCNETVTTQKSEVSTDSMATQTLQSTKVAKQLATPESMVVYFAFDKSEIHVNDISATYFDASNTYLSQNAAGVMKITGHTDAVGTLGYNQALGLRRAQSVKDYFEKRGIPKDKMLILSNGEKVPFENNNTSKGRTINRRAVITFKK
jgi:outer membrane protein OmpA-like peptidoglycan-associated protein